MISWRTILIKCVIIANNCTNFYFSTLHLSDVAWILLYTEYNMYIHVVDRKHENDRSQFKPKDPQRWPRSWPELNRRFADSRVESNLHSVTADIRKSQIWIKNAIRIREKILIPQKSCSQMKIRMKPISLKQKAFDDKIK